MKRSVLTLLALLGILTLILGARTLALRSRQIAPEPATALQLNRRLALERLSRAIQFQTVSQRDPAQTAAEEFARLHEFLRAAFPSVHKHLSREIVGGHSALYSWQGADRGLKPLLLMAHLDVVPAAQDGWRYPPFSGALADGYVWGRGAMDDKASALGILEAVEHLLAEGFRPTRTVYLAFGHDEEVGGERGAKQIAAVLHSRGITLELVVDEGLSIFDGLISGVTAPVALVGIAEKGYLSLQLTARAVPRHSSIPPPDTVIGILSAAVHRLDTRPLPSRLHGPTRRMLDYLGPEMSWSSKIALANLWLFDPLVRRQLAQSPLTNAAIRTTVAPTLFHAAAAENVLPGEASAIINLRLLPGDSIAQVVERIRETVNDSRVDVSALPVQVEPSPVSDSESAAFRIMQRTIGQIAPKAVVAPALLVAATDSRHYASLTPNILRFLPITLGREDAKRYHGVDERISFEDYERCVRFYAQLIRNAQP